MISRIKDTELRDISQGKGGQRSSSTWPMILAKLGGISQLLSDCRDWSPELLSQHQSPNSTLLWCQQQPRTLSLTDCRVEKKVYFHLHTSQEDRFSRTSTKMLQRGESRLHVAGQSQQ